MERRTLGQSGIEVSALGLGAGQIGDGRLEEAQVERLLHAAVDMGVTFFDSARAYGLSEERLGRHLGSKRADVVLSTKVGYGIEGFHDWTGPCITAGIDAALQRLRTDWIDVVHLHSCPLGTLEYGEVVEALCGAIGAGKIRVAAYSGEREALDYAVASGRFGVAQTSVNICDQRGLSGAVAEAHRRGLGVIAKRPLANAPWRWSQRPDGHYAEAYWDRLEAMGGQKIKPEGMDWDELALRFSAFAPGVTTVICGTSNPEHLRRNVALVQRGALPQADAARVRAAFEAADDGWVGQV